MLGHSTHMLIVTLLTFYLVPESLTSCDVARRETLGRGSNIGRSSRTAQSSYPEASASMLQAPLLKAFVDWNREDDINSVDEDHESPLDNNGEISVPTQLQQVLDVAGLLLTGTSSCSSRGGHNRSSDAGHSIACPAVAPELLQGRTSAFLSTLLRTYPHGPTRRDDLLAWAAAATAFLDEHHRLQRQQRQLADAAANAAAVALAQHLAAEAAEKRSSAYSTAPGSGSGTANKVEQNKQTKQSQRRRLGALTPTTAIPSNSPERRGNDGGAILNKATDSTQVHKSTRPQRRTVSVSLAGGPRGQAADARLHACTHAPNVTHQRSLNPVAVAAGGLPLVRRVLLAQLLLIWATKLGMELPRDPEVVEALARMITRLYYIHVESVVDRAAVEYFHISKAGGTSWSVAAHANGCSIPHAKASRVPEFDDDCRWFDPDVLMRLGFNQTQAQSATVCPRYGIVERRSWMRDCARRLEHFRRTDLHFCSNEYTLHGGHEDMYDTHICPQFVSVATIREPLGRLLSNVRYMMVQLKRDRSLKPEVFRKSFCNCSAADWEVYSPPVVDNYNIRTMVGEHAFHTPLYGIGEAHEALAKQLLMQYDLILDLNAGDNAATLLMRSGLGWTTTLADVHSLSSEILAKRSHLDFFTCPLGDLQPLLERQEYDQRWYSFGRALSHLDQLFLSAVSHMGLKPWPEDWDQRGLDPPPEDGIVNVDCGLVGLVPPPPLWPLNSANPSVSRK